MTVPTSHPSPAASSSGDSSPPSPTAPSSVPAVAGANSPALAKRKTSRRANTAERRATHNAVERARRETLNARFLLLASLLPNLSQIRRPSKSSIVNSSIAHVHASRRHRQLAARELRALKNECDAQRRELNEWRDRANMPRLEEPMRSEGFLSVLSGEMETLVVQVGAEDEDDEVMMAEYGYEDINDYTQHPDVIEDPRMAMGAAPVPIPPMAALPRRPSIYLSHIAPHVSSPIVASPTTMSFENPVMGVYESQHIPYGYPHNPHTAIDPKDVAAWNLGMYQQQQQQIILQQQRQQHSQPHPTDQAYLATLHRQRERSSSIASYHSATSGGGGTPPLSSGGSSPTMGFDSFPADGWMMGAPQPQPVAAGGGGNPVFAAMM